MPSSKIKDVEVDWIEVSRVITSKVRLLKALEEVLSKLPVVEKFDSYTDFHDEIEVIRICENSKKRIWDKAYKARYLGLLNVVLDLKKQGWDFKIENKRIYGARPSNNHVDNRTIRKIQFHAQRNEQLREETVQRFIKEVESPKYFKGDRVSIMSVMEDGRNLVKKIESLQKTVNKLSIKQFVDPYIELVTENKKCGFTGIKLTDIWRYFRYTWTNPSQSVPGRSMPILIRDRATKYHSIIGIAALSSSAMQLSSRDSYIGWSIEKLEEKITNTKKITKFQNWAKDIIGSAIGEIYIDDLLKDKLIKTADLINPNKKLLVELKDISKRSKDQHYKNSSASDFKKDRNTSDNDLYNEKFWKKESESSLFLSKRCEELSKLLKLRLVIKEFESDYGKRWADKAIVTSKGKNSSKIL